jgi:hypothetical protein
MLVRTVTVAGQQQYDDQPFPLVLECDAVASTMGKATYWVSKHRDRLNEQACQHGAVLFCGFPIRSAENFDAFVTAFDLPSFPYAQSLSNAVRVNRTDRVFTANEAPADVSIYLHHEMAQTPIFPSKLFFFCEQAAERGGATPLCRSDVLWTRLSEQAPDFARACEEKGLKYTNVMPPAADLGSGMGRSWQSTLGVDAHDKAKGRGQAEARLAQLGYTWTWLDDGSLRVTSPVLPAVKQLPAGKKTFFNQLIAATRGWKDSRNDPSRAITHGDGTPLDHDAVNLTAELAERLTFDLAWQSGDVVLIDNYLVMHGRRRFGGTRKVLASLIAAESHRETPLV